MIWMLAACTSSSLVVHEGEAARTALTKRFDSDVPSTAESIRMVVAPDGIVNGQFHDDKLRVKAWYASVDLKCQNPTDVRLGSDDALGAFRKAGPSKDWTVPSKAPWRMKTCDDPRGFTVVAYAPMSPDWWAWVSFQPR